MREQLRPYDADAATKEPSCIRVRGRQPFMADVTPVGVWYVARSGDKPQFAEPQDLSIAVPVQERKFFVAIDQMGAPFLADPKVQLVPGAKRVAASDITVDQTGVITILVRG